MDQVSFYERLGGHLGLLFVLGGTEGGTAGRRERGEPGALGIANDVLDRSVYPLGVEAVKDLRSSGRIGLTDPSTQVDIGLVELGFERMCVELLQRRLWLGSHEEIHRQRRFLNAAFASSVQWQMRAAERRTAWPVVGGLTSEEAIARACGVAERLEVMAIQTQSEATWIGATPQVISGEVRWRVAPLDVDLESGLAGVLWFLSWLSFLTRDGRWRRLAGRAAQAWVVQIARIESSSDAADVDWRELAYVAEHLHSIWHEDVWRVRAERWRSMISKRQSVRVAWPCRLSPGIETPGLMWGLAGSGDALLRVAERRIPDVLGAAARRVGRRAAVEKVAGDL